MNQSDDDGEYDAPIRCPSRQVNFMAETEPPRDMLIVLAWNTIIAGAVFNVLLFAIGVVEAKHFVMIATVASEGFAYLSAAFQMHKPTQVPGIIALIAAVALGVAGFGVALLG